jgi:hypothetical protein
MSVIEEQLVSRPETKTLFMSRRSNLRLVKVPRYPMYGAAGLKIGEKPGEIVEFKEGVCREDDPEVIQWLEAHPLYRDLQDGFWRVDPVAPPVSREELDAVLEAAFDPERLQQIIEQERSGWNRQDFLGPAENALVRLQEALADAAAQDAGK